MSSTAIENHRLHIVVYLLAAEGTATASRESTDTEAGCVPWAGPGERYFPR